MNFYNDDSPIIACSSGNYSNSALAVIRLSGFSDLEDLSIFFSISLKNVKPRFSYLTNIVFNNKVYDNGLFTFFPKGKSYTDENLLEISVHGNQLNVQNIINLFIENGGFRHSAPGEFTYRALKNKKINLSQVEGLDLLLNANSNLMLSQGLDILQGELHQQYENVYNLFLRLKGHIELAIDFSEDVGEDETKKLIKTSYNELLKVISNLNERTKGNTSSLLSPDVAVVGQTNAGKSSFFNLMVNYNRSIVSNIAGTTRDYVSEIIHVNGTNFNLIDTAGIRETKDQIESIGIVRAFEVLEKAFFKILIINPFETNLKNLESFNEIEFDVLLISHSDCNGIIEKLNFLEEKKIKFKQMYFVNLISGSIEPHEFGPIEPLTKVGPIEPLKKVGPIEPLKKVGPIEPLKKDFGPIEPNTFLLSSRIRNEISLKFEKLTENSPILIERHRQCINKIYLQLLELSPLIETETDVAIVSSEIGRVSVSLSELIGVFTPDEVLNSIFDNFCIGK